MKKYRTNLADYLTEGLMVPEPAFYDLESFDDIDMDHLRVAFMAISPAYACVDGLKRRAAVGKEFINLFLSSTKEVALISDTELAKRFIAIKETHKEYGSYNIPIGDWYKSKGRHIFDNWTNRHDVSLIGVTHLEGEKNLSDPIELDKALEFISSIASNKDIPQTMVISIPFDIPKTLAIKNVNILISAYYDWVLKIKDVEYRKRKPLAGQRERPNALIRKFKALICKAFHPEMPLWQIGLLANISPLHESRYVVKGLTESERNTMRPEIATLTSRAIRQGLYIAEHAAMDKFPVLEKISLPNYDWNEVKNRLKILYPFLSVSENLNKFHI